MSVDVQPALRLLRGGPIVIQGAPRVVDHLGWPQDMGDGARLCRCGQSDTKPMCDDACARAGFYDAKSDKRVPDRLDLYPAQMLDVSDNRGTCAHAGFCTDRVPTVFHADSEPFVTPSGARADDILRAVRRCPSGALGAGARSAPETGLTDSVRPPTIEISKDGPYRVSGGVALIDDDGTPVPRNAGASLEHYSLCRCGASLNKPFCSGMHWSVGFRDPEPDPLREPTVFEWAGGYPALLDMTVIFYGRHVPADPDLAPLFAGMSPDHPARVAAWLSEVFGGPKLYSERYGDYNRMISHHVGKRIRPEQRAAWVRLMAQSADEAGLPVDPEFRAAFVSYLEWGSRIALENSQTDAEPPLNMPIPRWWWVCEATPGARPSALPTAAADGNHDPRVEALPDPGEPIDFAAHIRPLFRDRDRASMRFAFDLWNEDDVRTHGPAILARLRDGSMPCDRRWATEHIELFARWLDEAVGDAMANPAAPSHNQ